MVFILLFFRAMAFQKHSCWRVNTWSRLQKTLLSWKTLNIKKPWVLLVKWLLLEIGSIEAKRKVAAQSLFCEKVIFYNFLLLVLNCMCGFFYLSLFSFMSYFLSLICTAKTMHDIISMTHQIHANLTHHLASLEIII